MVPDDILSAPREPVAGDVAGGVAPDSAGTIAALEGHVASLKTENERLAETLKTELEHHGAEIDTLKAQLANAEGRADETIRASAVQFAVERERADRAIAFPLSGPRSRAADGNGPQHQPV